jgi:hypothetical protein
MESKIIYMQEDKGKGYMMTTELEEKSRHSESIVVEIL